MWIFSTHRSELNKKREVWIKVAVGNKPKNRYAVLKNHRDTMIVTVTYFLSRFNKYSSRLKTNSGKINVNIAYRDLERDTGNF